MSKVLNVSRPSRSATSCAQQQMQQGPGQRGAPRHMLASLVALALTAGWATPLLAQSKPATDSTAGEAKLLCSAGGNVEASANALAAFATPTGIRLMPLDGKSDADCQIKSTAANLNVRFAQQEPVLLAGPVVYTLEEGARSASLGVIEPVLCESYGNGTGQIELALTDTNGEPQDITGFRSIGYAVSSARFEPRSAEGSFGPLAQCYSFPFAQLVSNPPDVPEQDDPNRIFRAAFESTSDLRVDFLSADGNFAISGIDAIPQQPFSYRIRVRNQGEAPAGNVRVREFLPKNVTNPLLSPVVDAGSWTCLKNGSSSCGTGNQSGTGPLEASAFGLLPGDEYVFTLNRTVPLGVPPARTVLGAAVFFDPDHSVGRADTLLANNSAPLVVELVANQAPVISCAGLSSPVSMQEDSNPLQFNCSLSDLEGDAITSFSVASNSGNPALIPTDGMLVDQGGDQWTLTLAPVTDVSGSAEIVLRAEDDRGAQRNLAFTVNVAEVNDAPFFDTLINDVPVFSDGVDIIGISDFVICSAAPDGFNCQMGIDTFFSNVSAGPANEQATQQVTPVVNAGGIVEAAHCGRTVAGDNVNDFFVLRPSITGPGGSTGPQPSGSDFYLTFTYRTTATGSVFCDFRFRDSDGAESAPTRVNFTVQVPD